MEKGSYGRSTLANTISDKEACLLLLPELTNPLPLFFPPSLSHPLSVATAVSHVPYPDSPQHSTASLAWHCTRCADGEQLQPITPLVRICLWLLLKVEFCFCRITYPNQLYYSNQDTWRLKLSSQIKSDCKRSETKLNCS